MSIINRERSMQMFLGVLALCAVGCGPSNGGLSLFTASAVSDTVNIPETSSTQIVNILANDTGQGITILKVTDGLYGTVDVVSAGDTVEYVPFDVNVDTQYADWFEYVVVSNNGAFDRGRVAIRFTDFTVDQYEPDDFQEFARYINVNVGQPVFELHTSDAVNTVTPVSGDNEHYASGALIGGDEDWFILDVGTAADAGLQQYLKIETILPGVADPADHNALLVRVMDEYGFLTQDLNGQNVVNYANGDAGNDNNSSTNDATTIDRPMAAGRYYVCVNPNTSHHGEYRVRFSLYDAAFPVLAPVSIGQLK